MKIVFATNNQHKLDEIRSILGDKIEVLSLKDIGCDVDIPETGQTLEENALQKAQYIYDHYHMSVFADDTGLEVEALNGAPGIYSARYASMVDGSSVSHDSEANMACLLKEIYVLVGVPASRKSISSKELSKVRLSENAGEEKASAMILFSNLTATTKPSLNWVWISRIISAIGHEQYRN